MAASRIPLACAFAVAQLAAVVGAQQTVSTGGRVLGVDGRPVADARVWFVGCDPLLGDRFAPSHRVAIDADERGRFVVRLRRRHEYSVWAAGPAHGDGARTVSGVERVLPGDGFELALHERRAPAQLQVEGLAAWSELARLRVEVAVDASHLHWVELVGEGPFVLPVAPAGCGHLVAVRDGQGCFVHGGRIASAAGLAAGVLRYELPPPRAVEVVVRDQAGEPLAGAEIRALAVASRGGDRGTFSARRCVQSWRPVGTTGADGTAVVHVPSVRALFERNSPSLLLVASRSGSRASIGGWNGQLVIDGVAHLERALDGPLPFTLRPGAGFSGRILGVDGQPLAGVPLELSVKLETPVEQRAAIGRSVISQQASFCARTGADGRFCFDALPANVAAPTLLVGGIAGGSGDAPIALLEPALDEPFELALARLPVLTVTAVDAREQPVRNGQVVLMPLPVGNRTLGRSTYRTMLDDRGSVRLPLQAGRWAVFVLDATGFGAVTVTAERDLVQCVSVREMPVLRGRLLFAGGAPTGDVQLVINNIQHGNEQDEDALALRAVGQAVNEWWMERLQIADDGSFELPVLTTGSRYTGWIGTKGYRGAPFAVAPSDEVVEFVLVRKR